MSKQITLLSLSVLAIFSASLIGCAEKSDHAQKATVAPVADKENSGENTEEVQDEESGREHVEEILKTLTSGGQPGKIELRGVIVTKDAENELVLDNRIITSQKGGKNLSGEEVVVDDEVKPSLALTLTSNQMAMLKIDKKTYINFGCELTAEETAGLTADTTTDEGVPLNDVRLTETVTKKAAKIFICGSQVTPSVQTLLFTDELILKQAHLTVVGDNMGGGLFVSANKVKLDGDNTILAPGKDSAEEEVLTGPEVSLAVAEKLDGQGSLIIETLGGHRVSTLSEEEKAKIEESTQSASPTESQELTQTENK